MLKARRRGWRLIVLATAAAGLAAAGIAYASIPGADGVITGCAAKSSGTLRVIDAQTANCSQKEIRLDWNEQGPRGPSDAFVFAQNNSFGSVNISTGTPAPIGVQLNLPAGSFIIDASIGFAINSGVETTIVVGCRLGAPNTSIRTTEGKGQVTGLSGFGTIPLGAAVTLAAPETVSVICQAEGDARTQPSTMTAIQVADLTAQSP